MNNPAVIKRAVVKPIHQSPVTIAGDKDSEDRGQTPSAPKKSPKKG